ncbi:MAG: hypothetical protein QW814_03720 [Methanothrix sp.]
MGKEQIGSVSNVLVIGSTNIVVMQLSAPLAVGEVITFDGWQDGITHTVTKMTQKHKEVTSASPGTVSVEVNSVVMIGAKVYKLTKDAGPEDAKNQSQAGQKAQDLGVVVPIASENTKEARRQVNNVVKNGWIDGNEPIPQANLAGTRTEFLNYAPSYAEKIKAKSFKPTLFYALAIVLLILPIMILFSIYNPNQNSNKTIIPPAAQLFVTLIFSFVAPGLIMLYVGFRIFSSEQRLSSIPPIKIDAATYGLNKMRGNFIPYKSNVLKSPISGAECIHFSVAIYTVFYMGNSTSEQTNLITSGSIGYSTQTLFTDGSGYLAVDFLKTPSVQSVASMFEIVPKEQSFGETLKMRFGVNDFKVKAGSEIAQEVIGSLNETVKKGTTMDLSAFNDLEFNQYFSGKTIDLKGNVTRLINNNLKGVIPKGVMYKNKSSLFDNFYIIMLENYIPSGKTYTCLGSAADIGKSIDDKPVKVLVPDKTTQTMSVHLGEEQNITKGMGKKSIISIAIGILLLICALGTITYYISYASVPHNPPVVVQTTIPSISTTVSTIPTSTTMPSVSTQAANTTAIAATPNSMDFASCANTSIYEPNIRSKTSVTCNWTGGNVTLYMGSGLSGYVHMQMIGSNNVTYLSESTTSWCPEFIKSVYLPPQKYTISMGDGKGGGFCNSSTDAVVYLK